MAVLMADNFMFHVIGDALSAIEIVDETDNRTVGPGVTIHYQFIYRGGTGSSRGVAFNIFVYDRSDIAGAGTPAAPEAGTANKPIPVPFNISPATPLLGAPELTQNLISMAQGGIITTNSIYAELISGSWNVYHRGSFEVTTPSSGYTDALTTFLGQAQITDGQ